MAMPPAATPRINTLMIEDDPDTVFLMSLRLDEACGGDTLFSVESASTLREGLELLKARRYDVLLLDLMLPDSDGLATVEQARAAAGDIPIVVLTGLADERLGLDAIAHGAQDFIAKDAIDARVLRRAISFAMERSARVAAERGLEKIRAEIRERKKSEEFKERIVSSVSHELRSPLTIAKAAVSNLMDGLAGALNPDQRNMANIALRNVDRLARLVSNFLDFSRLDSGRAAVRLESLSPGAALSQILEDWLLSHREGEAPVSARIPADLPIVWCDRDLFAQVVFNLLDNARRFARSQIMVTAEPAADGIVVYVADDGPGIPPGRAGELFQPFVQLERVGQGYKGTGLGLSICRQAIELCGGRIWADQTEGIGAKFGFTLPATRPKTEQPKEAPHEEGARR